MKYFKLEEFDSPDVPGSGKSMNKSFLELLEEAREVAGIPFRINSGYRTPQHNQSVGGVPGSAHVYGKAADIACTDGSTRLRILNALILVGFKRIGIAKTFIHADTDESKPNSVWLYS